MMLTTADCLIDFIRNKLLDIQMDREAMRTFGFCLRIDCLFKFRLSLMLGSTTIVSDRGSR